MRCDEIICMYNDGIGYCTRDDYPAIDERGHCTGFYMYEPNKEVPNGRSNV